LSDNHLAFVFPAFTSDYTDHPGMNMPGFTDRFSDLLHHAAKSFDPELAVFSFSGKTFLDDELRTQILTYLYSCTVSSILRNNGIAPKMNAGYSMGIYAALFDAGAISFDTGLNLIRTAYHSLHNSLNNRIFGMGALIGLDAWDIQQLIDQSSFRIEITNQNASHSFVVSGFNEDVKELLALAREEGALHTRDLAVSVPYHSGYLKEGAMDFASQSSQMEIGAPKTPVISLIDQISLTTPEIIRRELFRNLFQPLNWLRTMQVMIEHQVLQCYECGPSRGLSKNAKFVSGIRFSPLPAMLP
jgi:malonyl CoA-acyl carrier protein transacylase